MRGSWILLAVAAYVAIGVPVWWHTTSIQRPHLNHQEIQALEHGVNKSLVRLPIAVNIYAVHEGPARLSASELAAHAAQYVVEVLHSDEGGNQVQGTVLVAATVETGGACDHAVVAHPSDVNHDQSIQASPCLHLGAAIATWGKLATDAELDDHLHAVLRQYSQGAHGQYNLFILPEATRAVLGLPGREVQHQQEWVSEVVVGQYRHAWLWYQASSGPQSTAEPEDAARLLGQAILSAGLPVLHHCFAAKSGPADVVAARQLPLSAAAQVCLAFSLCNADPSSVMHTWDFEAFESQYLTPLVEVLALVADVGIESQVLLYTPARVNGTWSQHHHAHVIPHSQLPFFIDSDWALGALMAADVDVEAPAGSTGRAPQAAAPATGSTGTGNQAAAPTARGGAESGAADQSSGIPSAGAPGAGHPSHSRQAGPSGPGAPGPASTKVRAAGIPSHVLHFVMYVPPPGQELRLLNPDGSLAVTDSFWEPSRGGLHIYNPPGHNSHRSGSGGSGQSSAGEGSAAGSEACEGATGGGNEQTGSGADAGSSSTRSDTSSSSSSSASSSSSSDGGIPPGVRAVDARALQQYAAVVATQLRALMGLSSPLQLQHALAACTASLAPSSTLQAGDGHVHKVLPASSSGVSMWEVDALVRSRAMADVAAAAQILGSLSRLVVALPNLEVPLLIGDQVQAAMAAVEHSMALAREGDYPGAALAARAAHANAEAAFSHPSVLAQLSCPESHKLGVYVPLFLPAAVPLLQGLTSELARWIKARRSRSRSAQS